MKKIGQLLKKCSQYLMECEASVRGDMAKRIMHSILPSVADPAQVAATKGVVDYKSLAAAAEGRHDIIRFGTTACVGELGHYMKRDYNVPDNDVFEIANRALKAKDYRKALDICLNAFSDEGGWEASYGGKPWLKIAQTTRNILLLDQKLNKLRTNRSDPNFVDDEVDVLNDIVIQLNVFDGLAHNSGSIMGKVVDAEYESLVDPETGEYPPWYDPANEYHEVTKIMDSKEFENPVHVYKEIENTLNGTGDIYRYKDYTGKLRSSPDYKADQEFREFNLNKIRMHKERMHYMHNINKHLNDLSQLLAKGLKAYDPYVMHFHPSVGNITHDLFQVRDRFAWFARNSKNKYVVEYNNAALKKIDPYYTKIMELKDEVFYPVDDKDAATIYKHVDDMYDLMRSLQTVLENIH